MKKSDLKTGMRVLFVGDDRICIIVKTDTETFGVFEFGHARPIFQYDLSINTGSPCDVVKVYDIPTTHDLILKHEYSGNLLWERKEEKPILTLDGVEYSESTLRSIIKKATNETGKS